MAELPLIGKHGGVALVDDDLFPVLSAGVWWGYGSAPSTYAIGRIDPKDRPKALHRLILGDRPGLVIDHINNNPLDNRRANLRHCLPAENMKNRRKLADAASRFKGVWRDPRSGKWRVQIQSDGARIHLGAFDDEARAARQYDRLARVLHGEFAKTNAALGLL